MAGDAMKGKYREAKSLAVSSLVLCVLGAKFLVPGGLKLSTQKGWLLSFIYHKQQILSSEHRAP